MAITCTVAGTDRSKYLVRDGSMRYTRQFASSGVLTATFRDRRRGVSTWRPAIDNTLIILDGATTVFTGVIIDVEDRAVFEPTYGSVTRVTARDQMRFPDQRIVSNQTFASGQTLKQVLTSLNTTYLAGFSVTVDAGMASGPTLDEQTFDNVTVSQAFRHLMDVTGYVIYITSGLVLKAFSPGSVSASFSLTESNGNPRGALTWRQTRGKYVNTVYLIAGPNQQIEKTDTLTGDGVTTVFPLTYDTPVVNSGVLLSRGYVIENGTYVTLSATGGGGAYTYDSSTNAVTRAAGALGLGILATITYTVQFPIVVTSTDAAEVAANGPYDDTIADENITDQTAAQAAADGYLARYKSAPQTVEVETRQASAELGQSITLTFANRGISSTALIAGIAIFLLPGTQVFKYRLTCLDGTQAQSSWVDYFRGIIGGTGGSGSSGTATGYAIPNASGIFAADVVANSGGTGTPWEAALRGRHLNASVDGPALQLGRDLDSWRWFFVANTLRGSTPGTAATLEVVAGKDSSTYRRALRLGQADTPASGEYYILPSVTGKLYVGAPSGSFGEYSGAARVEAVFVNSGVYEASRTAAMGYWTTPTFSAGDYTAAGGTWTVGSGDVTTYAYTRVGRWLTVLFEIETTAVSAGVTELNIAIPGGLTAAKQTRTLFQAVDNGAAAVGVARVSASGTVIILQASIAGAGWTNTGASQTTAVRGQITLETTT